VKIDEARAQYASRYVNPSLEIWAVLEFGSNLDDHPIGNSNIDTPLTSLVDDHATCE
jgi:hypothetical protein